MAEELEEIKKLKTWQDRKHEEEISEMFARSQKELNDLDASIKKSKYQYLTRLVVTL